MKRIAIVLTGLFSLVFSTADIAVAQDTRFVRKHLINLCGPDMHGRGYYKHGDRIAADYIVEQFRQLGIRQFQSGYLQPHTINVNIINKTMVKLNGQELEFNKDYVTGPFSGSANGVYKLLVVKSSLMNNAEKFLDTLKSAPNPKVIILDSTGLKNPGLYRFVKRLALDGQFGIAALIEAVSAPLFTHPGRAQEKTAHLLMDRKIVRDDLKEIELVIVNEYNENYQSQNVIGYFPGQTDQFIVFTAHYDGYGSYGEGNYNPAAEDNASGTAMVMDLARHYAKGRKPYYSVAFMLFSGEEVGLMGSRYYVANPLFPLERIKLVINLDMVMTGQDGVILFNGNGRPNEAAIVQKINEEHHYMKSVENRDGTANSDHFPFQEKGVPAIFFLTKGPSGRGHGPDDTYDKLPLYAYENLFKLVVQIPEELRKQEID
jgi:hypothetical protein